MTGFKIRSVERWRFGAGGGQLCDASLGGELLPEARRQVLGNGSKQALANVHQEDESEAKKSSTAGKLCAGYAFNKGNLQMRTEACTRATTQKGSGIANCGRSWMGMLGPDFSCLSISRRAAQALLDRGW